MEKIQQSRRLLYLFHEDIINPKKNFNIKTYIILPFRILFYNALEI